MKMRKRSHKTVHTTHNADGSKTVRTTYSSTNMFGTRHVDTYTKRIAPPKPKPVPDPNGFFYKKFYDPQVNYRLIGKIIKPVGIFLIIGAWIAIFMMFCGFSAAIGVIGAILMVIGIIFAAVGSWFCKFPPR